MSSVHCFDARVTLVVPYTFFLEWLSWEIEKCHTSIYRAERYLTRSFFKPMMLYRLNVQKTPMLVIVGVETHGERNSR
jgi:hypothetical protein